MTVTITFTANDSYALHHEIIAYLSSTARQITATPVEVRSKDEVKEIRKEKKVKAEKIVEPKAEVLPPEKPKYTLQDAIDRAREIAGDGKDEKIMNALKGINTRLGISKVREIPAEKLDGYMKELNAEFPKGTVGETKTNMFD